MSRFKVGDKVVAVSVDGFSELKEGDTYTVSEIDSDFLRIEELGTYSWACESRFVFASDYVQPTEDTEEHTGGSSSYYTVRVESPTTPYKLPYEAECNDIIEALNMTFAEANNFKATWRTAAARQGKKKKGNDAVYDAEKCVFFSRRMLVAAKKGDV